jgi:hypothetical protein
MRRLRTQISFHDKVEISAVKAEDFQPWEDYWVLADLIGKGGHIRTAPIPAWVKSAVDA